ncbi:hypothetical protein QQ045_009857 [Rhodiola kirilowii]
MMLGGDVGTQYRSGIYYYNDEQERLAKESLDSKQNEMKGKKIVTEILPAKRFYRAEEYHQQYLAKGGRNAMNWLFVKFNVMFEQVVNIFCMECMVVSLCLAVNEDGIGHLRLAHNPYMIKDTKGVFS